MEKELHRAAVRGSVDALLELLSEDPQILNRTAPSLSDTPLHVASLLGHSAFAKELLSRNPELAAELDSRGSSPLHLAAAKGSVEIVKNLVRVNPDLGLVLDRDGFTPLHLGVIKGRAAVVAELARVRPAATRVLTHGGEGGLHLCVKHHRLEVLKFLMDCIGRDDEFVNWRDGDGNTVLHVAVAKKQLEVIKYLLANTKIDVNAQNAIGFTALDVLSHSTRDLRDLEIKQSLQKAAAPRTNRAQSVAFEPEMDSVRVSNSISMHPQMSKKMSVKEIVKKKDIDWLGRKRSSLMVVSSLIATVAFQAALSPPGGVWQDDYLVYSNGTAVERPHDAGQSVMAITEPVQYGQFMIFNTIAFLASLSIILLLVSGLPMRRKRWMWFQMVIMWIAITALSGTYFIGLIFMTPDRNQGSYLYYVTQISVLIWLALMGLVFIGNVIRLVIWLLRKYGYMEEKETDDSLYVDYDDNDEI
ncbi:ankyrin repeat-containing protein BDA1-like [Pyrus communis]|uniref:ankyrin repeat-containing protein BDA1-like n=1 Tax=Pyrus communis TaxID=23211 RepID=UPI0035C1EB5B